MVTKLLLIGATLLSLVFGSAGISATQVGELGLDSVAHGDGRIQANSVSRLPAGPKQEAPGARLFGEVTAVEGTTLVFNTLGGAVDVLTDAETVFRIPGLGKVALGDVEVGDQARAIGEWEDANTFQASAVGLAGERRAGQDGLVRGHVISVESDSLTLGAPHGPVTVLVDEETGYSVPGVDAPGLDNVQTGALVVARGTWNEDGTLQATGVKVISGWWGRGVLRGWRWWRR